MCSLLQFYCGLHIIPSWPLVLDLCSVRSVTLPLSSWLVGINNERKVEGIVCPMLAFFLFPLLRISLCQLRRSINVKRQGNKVALGKRMAECTFSCSLPLSGLMAHQPIDHLFCYPQPCRNRPSFYSFYSFCYFCSLCSSLSVCLCLEESIILFVENRDERALFLSTIFLFFFLPRRRYFHAPWAKR
jgi:hypothetical protein